MKKIIQVADSIHGTIQISEFEKQIISTQAFNRLHNVLQNSTAYLTYPSNQTKRFSHSLGAMHLGGLMFYHAIVNADDEVRERFFNDAKLEIEHILDEPRFKQILRVHMGDYVKIVEEFPRISYREPLYLANTPYVVGEDFSFLYILLYQAVRCTALLHDIGHPPFSHITENALQKILKKVESKPEETRTKRECNFMKIMYDYLHPSDEFTGRTKLHEEISRHMAGRLLENVVRSICRSEDLNKEVAIKRFYYILVQEVTNNIMRDASSFYKALHSIVDGSIDCDRLDYVTRDITNSGFTHGTIEYDRLISSYKLLYDEGKYYFCADVRTLSTVEDFFHRRWFLYKYVIYHHRVQKTDHLLEQAIIKLATDYLEKQEEDTTFDHRVLPNDISGLWRGIKEAYSDTDYFDAIVQWDDSWLWNVLRREYYSHYQFCGEEFIKTQLEELLSNRKNYVSIIKRMDDFLEIDQAVLRHFHFNWDNVASFIGKDLHGVLEPVKEYNQSAHHQQNEQHSLTRHGFFLFCIRNLLDTLLMGKHFEALIERSIEEAVVEFGVKDHIVKFNHLKTGLGKVPALHRFSKRINLNEVSRISYELKQNQTTFPLFYLYIYGKIKDKKDFREEIGKRIAFNLKNFLDEKLTNEL